MDESVSLSRSLDQRILHSLGQRPDNESLRTAKRGDKKIDVKFVA